MFTTYICMGDKIPVFDVLMDEEAGEGTSRISFVGQPANGSHWLMFSGEPVKMEIASEEEQKVFGPVLIPNQHVLRMSDVGQPFFIRFSAETIEKTRDKFMKLSAGNTVNGSHSSMILDGVFMIESFIKNSQRDMHPPSNYKHYPDGTLFSMFKVENKSVWDEFIKTGQFTGMSIEGTYSLTDSGEMAEIEKNMKMSAEEDIISKLLELEALIN